MPFDQHKNLAISRIIAPPSPADLGTAVDIIPGEEARFPIPPFNVTIWPPSAIPTPANAEVARVTLIQNNRLFIERAVEGTVARSILIGDFIAETVTAKALQDIESGTNFPLITTPGPITSDDRVVAPLGNFDYVNVANALAAQSITGETADFTSQVTAPLARFGTLDTTPLNSANLSAPIPDAKLSVNVLKHTGGYPGGTVTFLRADGTFQTVPINGGIPGLHAPTHAAGGTDPVTVTGLAGYPGGTGTYLRADGTFAVPGAVPGAMKWQQPFTWALNGDVSSLGFIPGFCVPLVGAQTAKIVAVRGRIHTGTSVNVVVYKANVAVTATIPFTTTVTKTPLGPIAIAADEEIILQLSVPVGVPTNLNVSLYVEYTV